MGCASSNLSPEEKAQRREEGGKNKKLDKGLAQDNAADQRVHKLLLLGAGESGKSTLFKQMIQLYGPGFDDEALRDYIPTVNNNVLMSIKELSERSESFTPVTSANLESKQAVDALYGDEDISPELGQHIKKLWMDPGIQGTYEKRSKFQLFDSAAYFFDRIDVIASPDFIPSQQDVMRCRVRTTGIVENTFEIDKNHFKMFDVGGQRNERKKWIHCFENVTAVIFVAAISAYDQLLCEDEQTNRLVEALNLFDEICNNKWFSDTSMILFLNKRDLFEAKLPRVPLSNYFPAYTGHSYEAACTFLKRQFKSKNQNSDKQVYAHVTCATDTSNIGTVFNTVKDILIQKSLGEAGLS